MGSTDRLIDPLLFNKFMHADVIECYNNLEFNEWLEVQWDSLNRMQVKGTLRRESLYLPQLFFEYVNLDGGAANFQNRWE